MCSALKDKGSNFSLSSEGCSPEATSRSRMSQSFLHCKRLRWAAFLERKKKPSMANEAAPTRHDNKVCRQGGSDLLDKKVASSMQTATKEDETVDKDCPLDLNPKPSFQRESIESVESVDSSEEDTYNQDIQSNFPKS